METEIMGTIRRAMNSLKHVRLFRVNSGVAYQGTLVKDASGRVVRIDNPHRITFVPIPGAADLWGWVTTEITPEMVGRKIAVFFAPEVKTSTGKLTKQQQTFADVVSRAGGISGVVRSVDDAMKLITDFEEGLKHGI